MKVVLVTGGFDPLHSGHIAFFQDARNHGEQLWVGINSDDWLVRKKGKPFLPISERSCIIDNLQMVDRVISFDDSDDTAIQAIHKAMNLGAEHVVFANGGDRTKDNIPELVFYTGHPKVSFKFGVGGTDKKNSSSWILEKYQKNT